MPPARIGDGIQDRQPRRTNDVRRFCRPGQSGPLCQLPRADAARHGAGRTDHGRVHGLQRLPGPESGPDLRLVHPGRGDLDGAAALCARQQHPGKQHGADPGIGRRHAVLGDLHPAWPADGRLLERLSVLADGAAVHLGRHPGGDLHHPAAPRHGGQQPATLP